MSALLLLEGGIALGGSSLLSSEARFFAIGLPFLAVWIFVVPSRVVRLQLERAPDVADGP